jgi:hypothetical protein
VSSRDSEASSNITSKSSSPLNGYLEGGKYIQTSENNNQISLQMLKAENNIVKITPPPKDTKKDI